jgi:HAMP domain-containing protein
MFLGILVLITALTISGIAIYYSVAGLVAIFAAAALPIMIMGGALEIGKLVTAVWLHRYWKQAVWWLKTYLTIAVVVLMLITSMGIFGFLSKAHIEQTSASEESIAKIETIESETARLTSIIERAENKIKQLESSGTGADANIQSQIDKEQDRIDKAFERIQPAIDQQNKIIEDARASDNSRTKPYEDQLASIQAEILRLETSAREYEDKIANLKANQGAVDPLLQQIKKIEEEIIRVTNQLQSTEKSQIRAGQAIIGVTSDGLFGGNTREALAKWVAAQQDRIAQIQGEISQLRKDATTTVDNERKRLAEVVKDIRTVQIPALKDRELTMLEKIDEVRQTESPAIKTARDEIQRLRKSAEDQVKQSQSLIERLQKQLANSDNADEIQKSIDEQNERIRTASNEIEVLTDEKIILQAEYRKLEAEVGPIKYIAEFIYGEQADKNLLEEAVRWVIITIIFVFDPLAVLLLIASQYTFAYRKDDSGERLRQERAEYERLRAQKIADNPGFTVDNTQDFAEEEKVDDIPPAEDTHSESGTDGQDSRDRDDTNLQEDNLADDESTIDTVDEEPVPTGETVEEDTGSAPNDTEEVETKKKTDIELSEESKKLTKEELEALDEDLDWKHAKQQWKVDNPEDSIKSYKDWYLSGKINSLPWEKYLPKKKRPYLMKQDGKQIKGTAVE